MTRVLLIVLCLATPAAARELYVNNRAGDDRATGHTAKLQSGNHGPLRTIGVALRKAQKGDSIVIANTGIPYFESLSLSQSQHTGIFKYPFRIEGNGAILDGTAPIPADEWTPVGSTDLYCWIPPRLTSGLLYIDGIPATFDAETDIKALLQMERRSWARSAGKIYFRADANLLPGDHNLRFTFGQTGITLYHVRHVEIHNLVVQGFSLDGINAHDGIVDCKLVGVTSRGNGRSGVSVGGSSELLLRGGVVGDNGTVQVRSEGLGLLLLDNTELIDNTGPAMDQAGGEIRQLGGAPQR